MKLATTRLMEYFANKKQIGQDFEERAVDYLAAQGYRIIARNVTFRFGEIDIVAEHGRTLVFVEVRKRDPRYGVAPQDTITFPKQQRLMAAIQTYLARYRGEASEVRIDLVGFIGENLSHFQDFIPL